MAEGSAVAARHWYSTASQIEESYLPVGLPGYYSVRGDWFLAVATGSRSAHLGDRALDVLISRRANLRRLQLGVGLPTRDVVDEDEYKQLRTKLVAADSEERLRHVMYGDLLKLGPDQHKKRGGVFDFHWLWRSHLKHYDRHAVIWQKWLHRLVRWWIGSMRNDLSRRKLTGFEVYDRLWDVGTKPILTCDNRLEEWRRAMEKEKKEKKEKEERERREEQEARDGKPRERTVAPSKRVMQLESLQEFPERCRFLIAALQAATPASSPPDPRDDNQPTDTGRDDGESGNGRSGGALQKTAGA